MKVSEEAAWNAYVAASDSLVELLNMDAGTLLVPVAYSKALNERMEYEAANAAAVALENRPELKSAAAGVKIARITLKFQRQQDRPDVSITGTVTISQTQSANGQRLPRLWRHRLRNLGESHGQHLQAGRAGRVLLAHV